jgi:hypothetical protein
MMGDKAIDRFLLDLTWQLRSRGVVAARIVRETRDHLQDATAAGIARGLSPADAVRHALATFGPPADVARAFAAQQYGPSGRVLAAAAVVTVLGLGGMALLLVAIRPPGVDLGWWLGRAALVAGISSWTLAALAGAARWPRVPLGLAGVVVAVLGARWVYTTVTGSHVEGYVVLVATSLTLQGVLTVARSIVPGSAGR